MRGSTAYIVASGIAVIAAGCGSQSLPASSLVRANAQRTGVFATDAVDRLSEAVWKVQANPSSLSMVVSSGTLVFGGTDGAVHAIDVATGQERWKYSVKSEPVESAPGIANGLVFIAGATAVVALDEDTGQERWRLATLEKAMGSPVVVDGVVYSADAAVYAIDAATGQEKWRYRVPEEARFVQADLAVSNSTVYAGTVGGTLVALNARTGQEIWTFRVPRTDEAPIAVVFSGPAVHDDVVYFGSLSKGFYAVDARTGQQKWSFTELDSLLDPVVSDGVVYLADFDAGLLVALNAMTGQKLWSLSPAGGISSAPILAGDILYVGGRQLSALAAQSGNEIWKFNIEGEIGSLTVFDHALYFGASDGYVYALR
jgi:outer membrane protein assembly factor BamB